MNIFLDDCVKTIQYTATLLNKKKDNTVLNRIKSSLTSGSWRENEMTGIYYVHFGCMALNFLS